MPCLIEIGFVVLEKIFKFRQYIFALSLLFSLEKGVAFHLFKLESPSLKDANWLRGSCEEDEKVKSL